MFNPLKHLFGEANQGQPTPRADPDSQTDSLLTRNKFGVTIDQDAFGPGAREAIAQEIVQRAGAPLFHGTVEHAYSKRAAGGTDKKEPNFVRTWNGRKAVCILDENQQCVGLETVGTNPGGVGNCPGSLSGPAPSHDRQKQKRKRKLAKLARKRNRRC